MNKKAIVITSPSLLMTQVVSRLEESGVTTKVLNKSLIKSKKDACSLAEQYAADGFDYVVYSALLPEQKYPCNILEMEPDEWEEWKTDVFSSSYYSYQFFKKLLDFGKGKYFVVGSSAGLFPDTTKETEGAASAAVFMDMRCVAAEISNADVTVNGFAVGDIEGKDAQDENKLNHIPIHRYGDAESIADRMVSNILSDDLFMNGTVINLDGGFSSRYMREW